MNLERFKTISADRDILMHFTVGNFLGMLNNYNHGFDNAEETLAKMNEFVNKHYTNKLADLNEQLDIAAKEE